MLTIAMDKIVLDFLCMYWLILWCRLQQKVKVETVIQIQTRDCCENSILPKSLLNIFIRVDDL